MPRGSSLKRAQGLGAFKEPTIRPQATFPIKTLTPRDETRSMRHPDGSRAQRQPGAVVYSYRE